LILYKEGQLTFCFTKDELPYLTNKNPWSTKSLSPEFKDYLKTLKEEPSISLREYIDNLEHKEKSEEDVVLEEKVQKMTEIDKILKKGLYKETDEYVSIGAYLELDDKYKKVIYKIIGPKGDIINFLYNNKTRKVIHDASYIYLIVKAGFLEEELSNEDLSDDRKQELLETIQTYEKMLGISDKPPFDYTLLKHAIIDNNIDQINLMVDAYSPYDNELTDNQQLNLLNIASTSNISVLLP
jgi:hypothetical protein